MHFWLFLSKRCTINNKCCCCCSITMTVLAEGYSKVGGMRSTANLYFVLYKHCDLKYTAKHHYCHVTVYSEIQTYVMIEASARKAWAAWLSSNRDLTATFFPLYSAWRTSKLKSTTNVLVICHLELQRIFLLMCSQFDSHQDNCSCNSFQLF